MEPVKDPGGLDPRTTSESRVGGIIQSIRTGRGLSLRTLATRSGFSPSFISQVEHGQASPSIASLEKIAAALGVTLSEFFARQWADADALDFTIVRAIDRLEIVSGWSRATVEALGPTGRGQTMEPVMLTLEPDGRSGDRAAAHAGQELAVVWDGDVRLTLADTEHRLTTGDAVTFRSAMPNRWENVGPTSARVLIVVARPPS